MFNLKKCCSGLFLYLLLKITWTHSNTIENRSKWRFYIYVTSFLLNIHEPTSFGKTKKLRTQKMNKDKTVKHISISQKNQDLTLYSFIIILTYQIFFCQARNTLLKLAELTFSWITWQFFLISFVLWYRAAKLSKKGGLLLHCIILRK